MSVPTAPQASSHAQLRLIQRAGLDPASVDEAWRQGTPVTVENRNYHHAKYADTWNVILLERGGVVTTVLHAPYEDYTEDTR